MSQYSLFEGYSITKNPEW